MEAEQLVFEGAPMANGSKVTIEKMALNKIKLNRNSRLNINPEELDGLMGSIKEEGLLQPIGVVKSGSGYEICYGNRRYLACSKLGFSHIPVIIHESKKDSDIDIKNLTENIQRRNISLTEIGRYMTMLRESGITKKEIAVRLGVTANYVDSCFSAFHDVPKEFQRDLVSSYPGQKNLSKVHGKIPMSTARSIINASKTYRLNTSDRKKLFSAAKESKNFHANGVTKYAIALKRGESDFLKASKPRRQIRLEFFWTRMRLCRWKKSSLITGLFVA